MGQSLQGNRNDLERLGGLAGAEERGRSEDGASKGVLELFMDVCLISSNPWDVLFMSQGCSCTWGECWIKHSCSCNTSRSLQGALPNVLSSPASRCAEHLGIHDSTRWPRCKTSRPWWAKCKRVGDFPFKGGP